MADHKREEEFKVIDRRLFTSQGELRKEALEEERREIETAKKLDASKPAAKDGAPSPGDATLAEQEAAKDLPPQSRSFQMLIDMLARNAAVMLGGYADPRTGQAILDLEGAREFIDMLDTLYEKTKGNLAPEDEKLLLDVAGSLKLSFVEISKAAAAQAKGEKAKTRG